MSAETSPQKQHFTIWYFVAAWLGLLLIQWFYEGYRTVETIPYSRFEQLVEQGSVSEVSIGQDIIEGKLKDKLPSGKSEFLTRRVEPVLAEKLGAKGIVVNGIPSGG